MPTSSPAGALPVAVAAPRSSDGPELRCLVRCRPGDQLLQTGSALNELSGRVEALASRWARAIAGFLAVEPPPAIGITLHSRSGMPMARGREVLLPVKDGGVNAGLAHELVHVVAGRSPSQVLNEGLAVHVDAQLRLAGDVWPFYCLEPRRWARALRDEGAYVSLRALTSVRSLRYAEETKAAVREFYLLAASFVGFLLAQGSTDAFWTAFRSGEPSPAGPRLLELEVGWLTWLGGPLDETEQRLMARSHAKLAGDDLSGWGVAPVAR